MNVYCILLDITKSSLIQLNSIEFVVEELFF